MRMSWTRGLFASRQTRELERVRSFFDATWYASTYLCDVPSEADPWEHYLLKGEAEGNDPCPWFSVVSYLHDHADVAEAGLSPFRHYVLTGRDEGRRIVPSLLSSLPGHASERAHIKMKRRPQGVRGSGREVDLHELTRRLFDENFYSAMYPDVARSGISAFEHFQEFGWREGRDPAPWFSTSFYVQCNPDVLAADVDPFFHFLSVGKREGRLARDPLLGWRSLIASVSSVEDQGRAWSKSRTTASTAFDVLVRQLVKESKARSARQVSLVVGNDDYVTQVGGVQACVATDMKERVASGHLAVFVWPDQPLPHLSVEEDPALRVRVNGKEIGVTTATALGRALTRLSQDVQVSRDLTVHGLMGHNPRIWRRLVDDHTSPIQRVDFWCHDFFAACSCYTLAPYGYGTCGAPDITSMRCSLCPYGRSRSAHVASIRGLLDAPETAVLAPSAAAANEFRRVAQWQGPLQVRPIGTITWEGIRRANHNSSAPLRIGFVGFQSERKGWLQFLEIARWVASRNDVELFHLGAEPSDYDAIRFVPVRQTGGDTDTMTRALNTNGIDVVLHWPTWHETFGITAHEALAAGCLVLTNPGAGNIAALSSDHSSVLVMDPSTLMWMLRKNKLVPWLSHLRKSPTRWGAFQLHDLSANVGQRTIP